MKKLVLISIIGVITLFGCRKDEPSVIYPINYYNDGNINHIPNGQTGIVSNVDLSNQGNQVNTANTTVIISGDVKMESLSINGTAIISEDATLTLTNQIQVSGGAKLVVLGKIITPTFTQISDTYLDGGEITVTGKYTIAGGATLYIQNSVVHVDEMIITGDIQHPENDFTKSTNVYSVIESIDTKYLNRAGGTTVCGPVLFTTNNDQGASGVSMSDVSTEAIKAQPELQSIYNLDDQTSTYYEYQDVCTPLNTFPPY